MTTLGLNITGRSQGISLTGASAAGPRLIGGILWHVRPAIVEKGPEIELQISPISSGNVSSRFPARANIDNPAGLPLAARIGVG